MSPLVAQAIALLPSLLGVIALIPGPDSRGKPRMGGPAGAIITYLGIAFLLCPWLIAPFLPQARLAGWARITASGIGAIIGAAGMILYALSFRVLFSAFRGHFSEFTPDRLVESGPYRFLRHPIYLSCMMILYGLCMVVSALETLVYLPFLYLLLRAAATYEERRILLPRFPDDYLGYKRRVKAAILGKWGGLGFTVLYGIPAGAMLVRLIGLWESALIE